MVVQGNLKKMEDINSLLKNKFKIDDLELYNLSSAISNCRILNYEFCNYPDKVLKDVVSLDSKTDIIYYPCDIVELSYILEQNEVSSHKYFILSNINFINKYLLDYPLFLGFNTPIDNCKQFGCLHITKKVADIKSCLRRVYIRKSSISNVLLEKINCILKEFNILNESSIEEIPLGLSSPIIK